MKKMTIAILVLAMAVVLYILIPGLSWTDDRLLFHGEALHLPATHCLKPATNHSAVYPVSKGESGGRVRRTAPRSSLQTN